MPFSFNTIKDPHWYAVQESDTTMMPRAASSPGQITITTYRYNFLPLQLYNEMLAAELINVIPPL